MYAVIETGGKQYRVEKGDVLDVELLKDLKDGKYTFENVLFFHNGKQVKSGAPFVAGCSVEAELLDIEKGPKVIAYKYKKRKNYRKKIGHRQTYSRMRITEIKG